MEDKYYTLKFNKKNVDKTNPQKLYAFKKMRSRLRVFVSKNLYVQLFTGNIACQDAYYNDSLKHMPLIVRVDEDGNAFDYINDVKIDIVGPVEIGEEISLEEAHARYKQMQNDPLSLYSYRESLKDCVSIIREYEENLNANIESPIRGRK